MKTILLRVSGLLLFWIALASPLAAQEAPALRLDLNIPALRLVVYEGDKVLRSYGVAVGKAGHDTPLGDYTIDHAEWNPWWRPPQGREWTRGKENTPPGLNNPMGRVKLFFAPLYFIHGTPEAQSIGSPASHGCVRMRNADVIELARLVHEHAASGVSARDIDRILARPTNTRAVHFQRPVAVSIHYTPVVIEEGVLKIYPDIYGYNAIHSESVYQALMAAGYSLNGVDRNAVQEVLARASRNKKAAFSAPVAEIFPTVALASSGADR
jgi:murein L,D-transpeptidase YcbB/YkuD